MNRLRSHHLFALLLLVTFALLGSCKKSNVKPLSQLKKEQRRAIDRLITKEKFQVISRNDELLPTPIDQNVFYKLSNGLYMRVLDKGSDEKAVAEKTRVLVRMKGRMFNDSRDTVYTFNSIANPSFDELKFL